WTRGWIANQSERERSHLPHFDFRIAERLLERRNRLRQADAADCQRRAAARSRLVIGEQAQEIGWRRRRADRRPTCRRRYEDHRSRRIRIAEHALILAPQDP